jgi:hypothetical protein
MQTSTAAKPLDAVARAGLAAAGAPTEESSPEEEEEARRWRVRWARRRVGDGEWPAAMAM